MIKMATASEVVKKEKCAVLLLGKGLKCDKSVIPAGGAH